jgi:flagellar basal body-associated protein FliL
MMKKKLTVLVAVLLVCLLLFPTAAFAYASDGEDTPAETPAAQSADAVQPADSTEAVGNTEPADDQEDTTLPFDTDVLTTLLAGMDEELLEVLKEHPKLIAMLLPTLHVTVREGSVTISIDKQEQEDPGRTGTVTTQGGNLNVRTGPSTGYDIITQLINGSNVKVLGEKDGWYQIEIPARYGYVCGEYVRVNDIPSTPTDDGYSFDIDQATILSFLELFQGMMQPAEIQTGHGLTPSGNLTLVDDYGERNGEGQQFVTLVTKNGNYFYLIIDRDEKGEETVHFLNLVDERDLFALMEDDEKAAYESQMAAEQAAREAAEKAAAEAASQTGESETQKPEDESPKEGKKTNMAPVLIIIVLMAAAGGGWFFMQTKKKKKAESAPDPDADYTDEDDEDYGAGTDTEDIDSYDVGDPYENEILDDPDESADSGGEDV